MATEFDDPNSGEDFLNMTEKELQCVDELRNWVECEDEFYGRTDKEFLIYFVRGCKLDNDKAKRKIRSYYDNRRRLPNWWANRHLTDDDMQSILQLKISTATIDKPQKPMVYITRVSRFPQSSQSYDDVVKFHTINAEVVLHRQQCQLNGVVWLVDCKDYPYWLVTRLLSPILLRNLSHSLFLSTPLRIKGIYFINAPRIAYTIWMIGKPFLTPKLRDRVKIYCSDWKSLYNHIPKDLLPEEYGGYAGPLQLHEDAFTKELLSFTDYIEDDNKYGFQ